LQKYEKVGKYTFFSEKKHEKESFSEIRLQERSG
jgi:hypothetical protein